MAADKRKKRTDEKPIRDELLDELLAGYEKPEDVIGENGLLKRLTKRVLERAMNAELTDHLGYQKHDPAGYNSGNSRNGTTSNPLHPARHLFEQIVAGFEVANRWDYAGPSIPRADTQG